MHNLFNTVGLFLKKKIVLTSFTENIENSFDIIYWKYRKQTHPLYGLFIDVCYKTYEKDVSSWVAFNVLTGEFILTAL